MVPTWVNSFIETQIRKKFLHLLREVSPDVILSVHPIFNGSILNILEKNRIKIPFVTLIADLVNIYPLWADNRADLILSPTKEATEKCIAYGIPQDKIKMFGFPVRSRFFRKSGQSKVLYKNGKQFSFLIMSGGEGVGNMRTIAENLLDDFDCTVRIVAGRNEKLKVHLEQSLVSQYGKKVEIYGFTNNIQDLMFVSDIAITRGSPNVMFEAVASNTPLIITGALAGQEEDIPLFAEKENLGVVCKNLREIKDTIHRLLEHDGIYLNQIIKSQREFMNCHAASDIVDFILGIGEPEKMTMNL